MELTKYAREINDIMHSLFISFHNQSICQFFYTIDSSLCKNIKTSA